MQQMGQPVPWWLSNQGGNDNSQGPRRAGLGRQQSRTRTTTPGRGLTDQLAAQARSMVTGNEGGLMGGVAAPAQQLSNAGGAAGLFTPFGTGIKAGAELWERSLLNDGLTTMGAPQMTWGQSLGAWFNPFQSQQDVADQIVRDYRAQNERNDGAERRARNPNGKRTSDGKTWGQGPGRANARDGHTARAGQQEGSKSNERSGDCFITTAVCEMTGEADDGPTLTALRDFRDTYMSGHDDVAEYYRIAPGIVEKIKESLNKDAILGVLNDGFIRPAVALIEAGRNEEAHKVYKEMVKQAEKLTKA